LPGAGHVNVALRQGVFDRSDFKALHGGLKCAYGVDFRHKHARAKAAHGLGAALAHVAVAHNHNYLASHHDVGGALDAVGQRLAAAVQVVELGLGDRVVDVDGGEQQRAGRFKLIESVHAGGGFFRYALYLGCNLVPVLRVFFESQLEAVKDALKFLVVGRLVKDGRVDFGLHAFVNEQGGVAAVVHYKVGAAAVGPGEGHLGAPPVIFKAFAFPGKNLGQAHFGNGGGGVVLGGKNVARCPADVRAKGVQGLDEHGRLYGHVQRARNLEALERLGGAVFFDAFHEPGRFALGKLHFFFAKVSQRHVGHFVVKGQVKGLNHEGLLSVILLWSFAIYY